MRQPRCERTLLEPGAVSLWPDVFAEESVVLMQALCAEAEFSRHRVRLFGRELPAPRLSAWHGEPGCSYRYSGVRHDPRPLGPAMQSLRSRVEALCGQHFNCVLLNLYRDGEDSMGWHSDDEPELGPDPFIASVSLGEPRRFVLRSRAEPHRRHECLLADGSLLLMEPPLQSVWQHALPKMRRAAGPRLNLTWRLIRPTGR